MTAREKALRRLRDAARRLRDAHEELDNAQQELVEAGHALDLMDGGADGVSEDK